MPGKAKHEEPASCNEDMRCPERQSVKSLVATMRICGARKVGAWRAWELQYAVPGKAECEEPGNYNEDMQCPKRRCEEPGNYNENLRCQERRSVKSLGTTLRICCG